jgi:hypothetical protein
MVLAMFVDAGQFDLLVALAGGSLFVTPTVADGDELPPYATRPLAEFARGLFRSQAEAGALHANRVARRTAFYQAVGAMWSPVALTAAELHDAQKFLQPATQVTARAINPAFRFKRIGAGEAEAAAVALSRSWTLWSDDSAIVGLLAALHPSLPVERIGRLLIRAVTEGLLSCEDAAHLYNSTFTQDLGLWTSLTLRCRHGRLIAS